MILLEALKKYTSEVHADYKNVCAALEKTKEIADYVNEKKRDSENSAKLREISLHLTGDLDVCKLSISLLNQNFSFFLSPDTEEFSSLNRDRRETQFQR